VNADFDSCVSELKHHKGTVCCVAYNFDSSLLASASEDKTVAVWNTKTGMVEFVLKGHTKEVRSVAWSPDGALIATGRIDGSADVWHAEDGGLLATLAGHADRLSALEFSPDGAWLVTASWDQSARLWFMEPVLAPPSPAEVETMWGASFADGEDQGRAGRTGGGAAPQPAP
jgi:WD40 repeat protein